MMSTSTKVPQSSVGEKREKEKTTTKAINHRFLPWSHGNVARTSRDALEGTRVSKEMSHLLKKTVRVWTELLALQPATLYQLVSKMFRTPCSRT